MKCLQMAGVCDHEPLSQQRTKMAVVAVKVRLILICKVYLMEEKVREMMLDFMSIFTCNFTQVFGCWNVHYNRWRG